MMKSHKRILFLISCLAITVNTAISIPMSALAASSITSAYFWVTAQHQYFTEGNGVNNMPLNFQRDWVLSFGSQDSTQNISHVTVSADTSNIGPITGSNPTAAVTGGTYTWEYDNVLGPPALSKVSWLLEGSEVDTTPGFDSSRQVDQEVFDAPAAQTLTVTFVPREPSSSINVINLRSGENDLVRWEFVGATTKATLNPIIGQTYTFQFVLNVTPKAGTVRFVPPFAIRRTLRPSNVIYSNVTNVTAQVADTQGRVLSGTAVSSQPIITFSAVGQVIRDVFYDPVSLTYASAGSNVVVNDVLTGVSVGFDSITQGGDVTVTETSIAPSPTDGFNLLNTYYDVSTQAEYSGDITVTVPYDDSGLTIGQEASLQLFHWNGSTWEDITVSVDTVLNTITGRVSSLSWLSVGLPPTITWLPPLSTQTVYAAQDGSTVPVKFQLIDSTGGFVNTTVVLVRITRDSDGFVVMTAPTAFDSELQGYRLNAQTKDWPLGDYTIRLSVNMRAGYGLSIIDRGQAKGKQR